MANSKNEVLEVILGMRCYEYNVLCVASLTSFL